MLSGNIPYITSSDHPDEMLSARLAPLVGQCLLDQDLESLASGLEGRTTNAMSLLMDALLQPCADAGFELEPLITFKKTGKEVSIPIWSTLLMLSKHNKNAVLWFYVFIFSMFRKSLFRFVNILSITVRLLLYGCIYRRKYYECMNIELQVHLLIKINYKRIFNLQLKSKWKFQIELYSTVVFFKGYEFVNKNQCFY